MPCCPSPFPLQCQPLPAVPAVLSFSSAHPQHPQQGLSHLPYYSPATHNGVFNLLLCLSGVMWAQNSENQSPTPSTLPVCGCSLSRAALLPCGTSGNGWGLEMDGNTCRVCFLRACAKGFPSVCLSVSCREAPGTCTC